MITQYGLVEKIIFFVHVVRLGSISSAAEYVSVSIATGSRWIVDLETAYQIKLLSRKGCSIQLTNSGLIFFEKWRYIVDDIIKINREIKADIAEQEGSLKICCTPVYADRYLLPIIATYSISNPKVKFNIDINPHGLADSQKYDIIFSALSSYDCKIEKNLDKIRKCLIIEPFLTVAAPSYLARSLSPTTPYELSEHQCLYARSLTASKEWAYVVSEQQLMIKTADILEVSDSNLLLKAVKLGLGIGYLPKFVVEEAIKSGEIIAILTEYKTSQWQLNMYYDSPNTIDSVALNFKNYYLTEIEKLNAA
ncbi:LysR family transcriptional regulator [Shewanella marina]|uniref:LysR family transcriptional regulator n=1 Tax=Shewanella marina TaxID=487319 RepID=UPI00047149CE|nr:LysR family transcriptional regulator [Shewanella marina]